MGPCRKIPHWPLRKNEILKPNYACPYDCEMGSLRTNKATLLARDKTTLKLNLLGIDEFSVLSFEKWAITLIFFLIV